MSKSRPKKKKQQQQKRENKQENLLNMDNNQNQAENAVITFLRNIANSFHLIIP